ncbi:lipopolysaccharide heptosyltransferase II [soil metagenome]
MHTIAVFLPNWIGDVVMATPAIAALRQHLPDARLFAVGKPYVEDVVAGADWFEDFVPFDKRSLFNTLRTMQAVKADTAVLFPNSLRPALLAKFAGCKTIAGYARYGRDFLLTHRLYATRNSVGGYKPMPVLDDYNRIVEKIGVPEPGRRMQLFTIHNDELAADRVWQTLKLPHRVIGLNPGGAFGASKHWPTEHFAEVARRFAERGHGVLVLCGPSERDEANRIATLAAHSSVVSLAEAPLSIGLTKAIVKRLSLLVTTDSGPRHFAAAFDVPVVSLFGPTHIGWTETHFEKATHLQKKLACGPCQQRVCPEKHHDCMTQLHPYEVTAAGLDLLRRFPQQTEVRHAG